MSASLLAFSGPAVAAPTVDATLRVVGANGKVLADQQFKTGTTGIKTSSKADCLGSSENGTTTIKGATAMGLLAQGSVSNALLRPIGFAKTSFGLGTCTIGGTTAPSKGYWALKVNHVYSTVGGSEAVLENGDIALWYLITNYTKPNPNELFLKVPSTVRKNKSVKATVYSYDDAGKRSVVKGAKLNGVNAPVTNGNGVTTLKLKKTTSIAARLKGSITSNRVKVSVKG